MEVTYSVMNDVENLGLYESEELAVACARNWMNDNPDKEKVKVFVLRSEGGQGVTKMDKVYFSRYREIHVPFWEAVNGLTVQDDIISPYTGEVLVKKWEPLEPRCFPSLRRNHIDSFNSNNCTFLVGTK